MRHPKCHGIQLGVTKYVSYTSSGSIRVKILLLKVFLFYSFQFINVSIAVLQGHYGDLYWKESPSLTVRLKAVTFRKFFRQELMLLFVYRRFSNMPSCDFYLVLLTSNQKNEVLVKEQLQDGRPNTLNNVLVSVIK